MYIHGSYYNINNEKITVHILTHNDRSEEVEIGADGRDLFFTDDPVEIISQVNDTFDHLLCNQASVRLYTRNFMPDFFCPSCRDAVVNIYREDQCVFAGYVEPQTYSQGYNEEFDEVELTCIDALIALQYSTYRNIGSAGVAYADVRAEADMRTFWTIMAEVLNGITASLDIVGSNSVSYLYDMSKKVNKNYTDDDVIFSRLSVNELLFLGDEVNDVWTQDAVLTELLKYLNLHIVQDGFAYYIFSWETLNGISDEFRWLDMATHGRVTNTIRTIDITSQNVTATDATISVDEVYNKIALTCDVKSVEGVIESPLDRNNLKSDYSNKQLYMREYSSDGEGYDALNAFDKITHGGTTTYQHATITDWYVQVKTNPQWTFYVLGSSDADIDKAFGVGMNQHVRPTLLRNAQGASLMAFGKVETKFDGKDNSLTSSIDMTNYLVVSVNGNGDDKEGTTFPTETSLVDNAPVAIYNGNATGAIISPTDDETTNYVVISGKVILNPLMDVTDTYKNVHDYTYHGGAATSIANFKGHTVPSRNNKDGRYYTQQWFDAVYPQDEPAWGGSDAQGMVPYTGTGPQQYEFNYSAEGDGSDTVSKVSVLACMLIVGDKVLVEKPQGEDLDTNVPGTGNGQVSDFIWRPYKVREACASDDEYYQQSFTIGFDPKKGDKLIGTSYDLQNNISHELGLDAEGIAIPIRKSDEVKGRVTFMILGPVNCTWDVITRRHPTWFRHTKWSRTTVPLMAHVSSIFVEELELKIYSDNGLVNNTSDKDIIYISDTQETFHNTKDDIEFKLTSTLTTEERQALGVTDSVKMSAPVITATNKGLQTIYDCNKLILAKAEQLYVDSYYNEYHVPRVELTVKLADTVLDGIVDRFVHYRHPYMGKTFYVEGITRNLTDGYAEMKLKEIVI